AGRCAPPCPPRRSASRPCPKYPSRQYACPPPNEIEANHVHCLFYFVKRKFGLTTNIRSSPQAGPSGAARGGAESVRALLAVAAGLRGGRSSSGAAALRHIGLLGLAGGLIGCLVGLPFLGAFRLGLGGGGRGGDHDRSRDRGDETQIHIYSPIFLTVAV